MNGDGIMKAVHNIKSIIWILIGLLSIVLLLKAYIKIAAKFIVHIAILLAGVISFFFVYINAKRMRHHLCEVKHTMCSKLKKQRVCRRCSHRKAT